MSFPEEVGDLDMAYGFVDHGTTVSQIDLPWILLVSQKWQPDLRFMPVPVAARL